MLMQSEDIQRVGISIKRYGTWRETVTRYASYKGLVPQALARFDVLTSEGMMEQWAALKALDEICCADVLIDNQSTGIEKINSLN